MLKALNEQVKVKLEVKRAESLAKAVEKERLAEIDAQSRVSRRKAKQLAVDKSSALKRGLDVQVTQQRKAIRAGVGMNHTERALNRALLVKAARDE